MIITSNSTELPQKHFFWFLRLRWLAIFGQGLALAVIAKWLSLDIQFWPLLGIFLFVAASNIFFYYIPEIFKKTDYDVSKLLGPILVLDIFILTLLLQFSGGPENPFSICYLLLVVVGAVVMESGWSWLLSLLTILCFGLLFIFSEPTSQHHAHENQGIFTSHLFGMWIAYSFVALISAYCISRISKELRISEQNAKELKLSQQSLTSLTTLSAGAAHELSTPLGTVMITIGELKNNLRDKISDTDIFEDLSMIEGELERCKYILKNMGAQSGEILGEIPEHVLISNLVAEIKSLHQQIKGLRLNIIVDSNHLICLPKGALIQSLCAIIKNSIDSYPEKAEEKTVEIKIVRKSDMVEFIVSDQGMGISQEVLKKLGEPFLTTKEVGKGMGLGLFLSRLALQAHGGYLKISSKLNEGTEVVLALPYLV